MVFIGWSSLLVLVNNTFLYLRYAKLDWKAHKISTLYKQLQATEESWELEVGEVIFHQVKPHQLVV